LVWWFFCIYAAACVRHFLKNEHIKYAAMAANIYILLLGETLLSIDLMWNEKSNEWGSVPWTSVKRSLAVTMEAGW
jgi:hypothetical protein